MMWVVEKEMDANGEPTAEILHLDTIVCAAHLIGKCGRQLLDKDLLPGHSLDAFKKWYVNKYIDHHA